MSISTKSKFYFDYKIDSTNNKVDFNEGSGEVTGTIDAGSYTFTTLATALENALNAAGGLTYAVTLDRVNRYYTITTTANFDLLIATGTNATSTPWSLLGFGASDLTGALTYTSTSSSGNEYKPQFILQDYVDPDDNVDRRQSSVSESASGIVQVANFGVVRFIEMNIRYINSLEKGLGIIEDSATGKEDAQVFMKFITRRDNIEYMPDRTNESVFLTLKLESTRKSSTGVGYKLNEINNLPGYYDTGVLTFRVVE